MNTWTRFTFSATHWINLDSEYYIHWFHAILLVWVLLQLVFCVRLPISRHLPNWCGQAVWATKPLDAKLSCSDATHAARSLLNTTSLRTSQRHAWDSDMHWVQRLGSFPSAAYHRHPVISNREGPSSRIWKPTWPFLTDQPLKFIEI